MTSGNAQKAIRTFQKRRPFKAYLVELVGGEKIAVEHPEAMVYRAGTGVYFAPDGELTIPDHEGVSRIASDLKERTP